MRSLSSISSTSSTNKDYLILIGWSLIDLSTVLCFHLNVLTSQFVIPLYWTNNDVFSLMCSKTELIKLMLCRSRRVSICFINTMITDWHSHRSEIRRLKIETSSHWIYNGQNLVCLFVCPNRLAKACKCRFCLSFKVYSSRNYTQIKTRKDIPMSRTFLM